MESAKDATAKYYVWGPNSGGVYFLEVTGERLVHRYGGDAAYGATDADQEERVVDYLFKLAERSPNDELLPPLRAGLDGVYALSTYEFVRFASGIPVEVFGPVYCDDPGRGGHVCAAGCVGPVKLDGAVARVAVLSGRSLTKKEEGYRSAQKDPSQGEAYVRFDR